MTIDIDNHKLMYHPDRIAEWKETGDCFPIYAEIGLTNKCNHDCIFCGLDFLDKNRTDFIDTKVLCSVLKDMGKNGVKSLMFAGEGESTLHKDIGLFTKTAKQSGMDVSITTNGVPFIRTKIEECMPHLDWIRFSLDAENSKDYAIIHGTTEDDFDKVINNIRDTVKFRNENSLDVNIAVQCVLIPKNFLTIEKLVKKMKKIGVDNIQIKPYMSHPLSKNNFKMSQKKYKELSEVLKKYNTENFKVMFRHETMKRTVSDISYNTCHGLSMMTLIDAKGNIVPCNLYLNKIMGNIYKKSFSELWKGKQRKKILAELNKIGTTDCRKSCRLDVCNKYLDRVKHPTKGDNFI